MNNLDRFRILSQAADWDAAAPSPLIEHTEIKFSDINSSDNAASEIREDAAYNICKVKRLGGGSVPILKILLSNACSYNCAYCVNRRSSNIKRASFQPEELARTIADFNTRGIISGAFISSGVIGSPDNTMERLVWTAQTLRERYGYKGYLHLKVIPGASPELVKLAMRYATRVSVNIELPTEESLVRIAPDKSADSILSPMKTIYERLRELDESNRSKKPLQEISIGDKPAEMSAGQTTQLIVGASPESDHTILSLAYHLYRDLGVRRVYYSAFRPEGTDPSLPRLAAPPYIREYRLYQADMLFRWYDFEPIELFEAQDSLDEDLDPKTSWALRHLDQFPVELATSDYEQILRVPGIGPATARRILNLRRAGRLNYSSLRKLRMHLQKAFWFITINGKILPEEMQNCRSINIAYALEHSEILHELLKEKTSPPAPIQPELDFSP
ncbi:MAG TPA: putative DNA modification/repair radical SAM protein [Rectinema sp.]|jgi:putative DNA modification/repair radical SAM protein|nr:putative DNA modification/repair radical SAM protein [Rectinema sp.]